MLLKAALAHVQFETIHPFLDGNGRLGRLLITLLLCKERVLREPLLYLSLYFKAHRSRYYELLGLVRETGDWESWLQFFADAVVDTANQAVETAEQLMKLSAADRQRIEGLGRVAGSALRVHRTLLEHPIAHASLLCARTGLAAATVNASLRHLERLGVVREITNRKRNRLFSYDQYVGIVSKGTEPIR